MLVAFTQPWGSRVRSAPPIASELPTTIPPVALPSGMPSALSVVPPEPPSAPATVDVVSGPSEIKGDWRRYPVPSWCAYRMSRCTMPKGEPGIRCGDDPVCFNPCPRGKAPNEMGFLCLRKCRSQAECRGGTCTEEGLCDRTVVKPCREYDESCELPGRVPGFMCNGKCFNPCGPGNVLVGGTHCAKQCRHDAQCGGKKGSCNKDGGFVSFCGGLCPSESCPYPYD